MNYIFNLKTIKNIWITLSHIFSKMNPSIAITDKKATEMNNKYPEFVHYS